MSMSTLLHHEYSLRFCRHNKNTYHISHVGKQKYLLAYSACVLKYVAGILARYSKYSWDSVDMSYV